MISSRMVSLYGRAVYPSSRFALPESGQGIASAQPVRIDGDGAFTFTDDTVFFFRDRAGRGTVNKLGHVSFLTESDQILCAAYIYIHNLLTVIRIHGYDTRNMQNDRFGFIRDVKEMREVISTAKVTIYDLCFTREIICRSVTRKNKSSYPFPLIDQLSYIRQKSFRLSRTKIR